ncbi:MAG: radical SAM protein [Candidatus Omnitrophota bacterium]|nr:radical SAM protein [Candidatus Omnitrophota bacterium]
MKKLKVVLVVPNFRWVNSDINALWHYTPYNLCLLAAVIKDICDVSILDAYTSNMSEDAFKSELRKLNPDIVGITVLMDQYASSGHTAAKIAKSINREIIVVMGGVYATVNPERAVKDNNIDFVVVGEGEYALRDLIGYVMKKNPLPQKGVCYSLDGKIVNTGHADFIKDLDDIPLPAYHLINFKNYANSAHRKSVDSPRKYPYARIMTSRGCPYGCSFCQVEVISGREFRPRSAKNVLDEIAWLKKEYGIKSLIFDDDNLFTDRQRAKDIFQGMIDRDIAMPWASIAVAVFKLDEELIKLMKASGCEYIDIAIESGTERVLKKIIKKPVNFEQAKEMARSAKKEGIYVAANFIIGFPTETWDEIRQTIKFAEDIDVDYAKIFTAMPLRNTKLWELCEKESAFKEEFDKSEGMWNVGQIETKEFSSRDLTILRAYEWDRINFTNPEKRKKTAAMMGMTEDELKETRKRTFNSAFQSIK